jgi:long-chain acyl-CoA synthetase
VPDHVSTFAESKPDEPALIQDDLVLTWAQYASRRDLIARGLQASGVSPGDSVAIYEVNSVDFLVVLNAVQAIGATGIPVNWRLSAEEVLYVLDNSDAVAAFVNESNLPLVDEIVEQSAVRQWIVLGDGTRPWAEHVDDLLARGHDAPVLTGDAAPGATMMYTGGTTGRPKGVRRQAFSDGTVDTSVLEAMGAWTHTMRLDLAHTHLVTAALYHQGPVGYATLALVAGGTAVIMRKFDPEEALRLIEQHRCTSTFMPPVVAKRVLDLPEDVRRKYDTSSLEVMVVTAGPVPQKLKLDILDAFGPVYYEAYSSTETALCATALTPADVRARPGSCGRAVAGAGFTIRDEHGNELPTGERGLICCRNQPGVFDGYHKDPELTKDVIRDEWLTVGDVGYMDDDGFLYIVDRVRDMIISGGTNIYSAEIENVLHEHPAIRDVAVFGVPDEEWGERVHAAVQLKAGESLTLEELQEFARRRLAGYKIPRGLSVHDDFPRDAAGKLAKRRLRAPFWPEPETVEATSTP